MMIIKPFFTEKSIEIEKNKYYTFFISSVKLNKIQIKKEILKLFGVSVKKIKTIIYPKKNKSRFTRKGFLIGRTKKLKKIIVQFKNNLDLNIKKNIF